MAWIYLAGSEGSRSPSGDGSAQSLTVKTTDSLKQSSSREWLMDHSPERRSGTMFRHYMGTCSLPTLTSYTGDFPVRTSPARDFREVWRESGPVLFGRSGDWQTKFDPDTYSWKTSQPSLLPDLILSSPRLPNAGLMLDGCVYPLPMWERAILETDGGSSLPTPTIKGDYNKKGLSQKSGDGLITAVHKMIPTPTTGSGSGSCKHTPQCIPRCKPHLDQMAKRGMLLPTPTAFQGSPITPETTWNGLNRTNYHPVTGKPLYSTLTRAISGLTRLPTPLARDGQDGTAKSCANIPENGYLGRMVHRLEMIEEDDNSHLILRDSPLSPTYGDSIPLDGRLSPHFVEQMMGYSLGWTDLEALVIQWFRSARGKRSKG